VTGCVKRLARCWPLSVAGLLVAVCVLPVAPAGATSDTVIGFDDIQSDGVTVTNQYASLGVTFGSSASFGLSVPTYGCGAPVTGSSPPDYDGGGRWVQPPRCPGGEFGPSGTALAFSWPHETLSVWALAEPGASPTLRMTGYDSGQNQVAQTTQALSPNFWTHVTLSTGFLSSISYLVIDNDLGGQTPNYVLDSLQYDAGAAPLSVTGVGLSATAGSPFTGTVGHISDADTTAVPSDFTAQITWGDGATSAGTVSATAPGSFDISGTHTYAAAGTLPLSVQVQKINKAFPVTGSGTADVAAAGGGGGGGGGTPGTLKACYHPPAGSAPIYVIGLPGAPAACDPGDVAFQWDANGRVGPQGPLGPDGPGTLGPSGARGRQGEQGPRGAQGARGSVHPLFEYVEATGSIMREDGTTVVHAQCPPHEILASGGFQSFNSQGNLYIEKSGPVDRFSRAGPVNGSTIAFVDPLRTWGVTAARSLGGNSPWHVDVYLLCWHR
jgi:hypothetical protein